MLQSQSQMLLPHKLAAETVNDLQKAIKSARGEQIAEEMNQKRRSRNCIIRGVAEDVSDIKKWSSGLVDDIHVQVPIKWVSRIETKTDGKNKTFASWSVK